MAHVVSLISCQYRFQTIFNQIVQTLHIHPTSSHHSSSLVFLLLHFHIFRFCAAVVMTNPPILANIRIEGKTTIFEGEVWTRGRPVTTPCGGTHCCDGTNNGASCCPGATSTTALADAAEKNDFTFCGTFDPKYDDFFITRIKDTSQTDKQFWRLLLNFDKNTKGGCQQKVTSTDKILWAFDGFNKQYFLSLSGPETARTNQPITVTVIDGADNVPIQGASVGGQLTDADGHATLTFDTTGVHVLKAERNDSIRSNALKVTVTN